jgi:FixJ family two-component response regulator
MSGFAEPPLHRAADAQGVQFLSKPFAMADLVGAIATAFALSR